MTPEEARRITSLIQREQRLRAIRETRQPAPGGWAVAVAVLIALACVLGMFVVMGVALVKGSR